MKKIIAKLIAFLFVILLIAGAIFWIGRLRDQKTALENQLKEKDQMIATQAADLIEKTKGIEENEQKNEEFYRLPKNTCSEEDCLFQYNGKVQKVLGLATIRGYFTEEKEQDNAGEEVSCPKFVVTTAPEAFLTAMLDTTDTVNTSTVETRPDQPVISINMDRLLEADKRRIRASTQKNPLQVVIFSSTRSDVDTLPCTPAVDVIRIK
ncbi:MAG TPA: hypothetical protein VEA18_02560 [Candidatus Kapabacteria bacterium]|nr:hypothetical protein [Candidatus Kapabacteria bacterium]